MSNYRAHYVNHAVRIGSAPLCHTFSNIFALLTIRTNLQEKKFVCEICGFCFGRPSALKQHLQLHSVKLDVQWTLSIERTHCGLKVLITFLVPPQTKKFECELCSSKFHSENLLQRHHIAVHEVSIFSCSSLFTSWNIGN